MSRAASLSNYEIRAEGWAALVERLGVSGAVRFLMEYDPGRGDYVEERRALFRDLTVRDALDRARGKKTAGLDRPRRREPPRPAGIPQGRAL
jgi:hypothetical protein